MIGKLSLVTFLGAQHVHAWSCPFTCSRIQLRQGRAELRKAAISISSCACPFMTRAYWRVNHSRRWDRMEPLIASKGSQCATTFRGVRCTCHAERSEASGSRTSNSHPLGLKHPARWRDPSLPLRMTKSGAKLASMAPGSPRNLVAHGSQEDSPRAFSAPPGDNILACHVSRAHGSTAAR